MDRDHVYIRQLYVERDYRRQGIASAAIDLLKRQALPSGLRLRIDVLCTNVDAIEFWRSVGFSDYCITMESDPQRGGHDARSSPHA